MGIFKRKKKVVDPVSAFKLTNSYLLPFIPFGDNITKSDVVMICIDRIASQCAKLKMSYVKKNEKGEQSEKNGDISFVLKHRVNKYMTPYQFLYKTVTLLLLNDNAFVYPLYDKYDGTLEGLYPLRPIVVEPIEDEASSLFLKFYFEDGRNYIFQ